MRPKLPSVHSGLLFPRTIDELFNQFWGETRSKAWTPIVDLTETDDAYVVRAELPGVDVSDVEVTATGDTLTIQGEKKAEKEIEDEKGHIAERVYGAFSRSFTFPVPVSTEGVIAEARRGVLYVTVKKAEAEKTRRIEITGD